MSGYNNPSKYVLECLSSQLKCVANLSLVPSLKPFWCLLVKLFENVTPLSKRMERYTTPSIAGQMSLAFSSKRKVANSNKTNSSIKPNKFHSKYVCFCSRKTREERKICLKIRLSGFPQRLLMSSATTAARKGVSSSTLIGPFKIEQALKFNGRSHSRLSPLRRGPFCAASTVKVFWP